MENQAHISRLGFAVIALALTIQVVGSPLTELLCYDREAIQRGQVWRIFSGHLVHLSWAHLLLNTAALLLLVFGFARHTRLTPLGTSLASVALMLGVSGGMFVFSPQVDWYVGLSGVLHGWWILMAVRLLPRETLIGLCLLVGLTGKVAWEQTAEQNAGLIPIIDIGGPVLVDAHLYGLGSGALIAALYFARQLCRHRSN